MDVCCEDCVLSGRGLCDKLITRPEESYRLWCVIVCDLKTSWMRRPWPTGNCRDKNKLTNKSSLEPVSAIHKGLQHARNNTYKQKDPFKYRMAHKLLENNGDILTHWGRGHLNCLNARSRGLNNLNQILYSVSLNIYNKFANYFCELKVSGNTHQRT